MSIRKMLLEYTHGELGEAISAMPEAVLEVACELRLRVGLPLIVRGIKGEYVSEYLPKGRDVSAMLDKFASHSLYAFDSEIKNGFITIAGGHRVGICGRVAVENGRIKTIRHISGLTIRIARQVIGAAEGILPYAISDDGQAYNSLIISSPGQGKTTILRDLLRLLSLRGSHVSVVDERSEIAGSHLGITQNDLGPRTDVLDAAPKAEGMLLMLRAMSPDVIAVDEIGGFEDVAALMTVACCGARILATLHGESIEDLKRKPVIAPLLENKIFNRYIFLTNKPKPGSLKAVYDADLRAVSL